MLADLPHITSHNEEKEIGITIVGTPGILAKNGEIGITDIGLDRALLLQEFLYNLPSMFLVLLIPRTTSRPLNLLSMILAIPDLRQCLQ